MSGEESNPVINDLKREIKCLETDLIRYKLLSNCYQKYFDYFNEFNETIDSNEELLKLKDNIKVLKEGQKPCFVSVEKLRENQSNQTLPKRQRIRPRRYSDDNELIKQKEKQVELDKLVHGLLDKFNDSVGTEEDYNQIESLLKEFETKTSTKRFKFLNRSKTINKTSLLILEVIALFQERQLIHPDIKEIFEYFGSHINDLETKCNDNTSLALFNPKTHKKDNLSEFVHSSIEDKLVPTHIKGDGNCLWNSVSVSLFGNYKMMESLRILTATTLLKHKELFTEYITIQRTVYGYKHELDFDGLVGAATELKVWGNELHIMALSLALKRPIFSYGSLTLFPEVYTFEELKQNYEKETLCHFKYVADPSFEGKDPILLYFNGEDHYSVVLQTHPNIKPLVPQSEILEPLIKRSNTSNPSLNEQSQLNNDSEDIDCDIKYKNQSNDKKIDGIIDENCVKEENPIKSEENVIKADNGSNGSLRDIQLDLNIKNEIQSEDNEEEVPNESLRRVRKRKHNSISSESEDIGIECNDNSDNCENTENIDEISDYSKNEKSDDNNKYICEAEGCGYSTKNSYDFNFHKSIIHSKEMPFVCSADGCDKRFGRGDHLRRHKRNVHKIEAVMFVCEDKGCGKQYNCEYKLRQHMKTHPKGGYKCQSENCSAVFYLKKDFVNHMIEHKIKAIDCNDKTKSKSVTENKSTECEKSDGREITHKFKCDANGCKYSSKKNSRMILHWARVHSKVKPFICSIKGCDKRLSNESDLRKHKRRVHKMDVPPPKFVCEDKVCGMVYNCEYNLRQHMKVHSEGGYKCQWEDCSVAFYRKKDLERHVNKHKKEAIDGNHKTKTKNTRSGVLDESPECQQSFGQQIAPKFNCVVDIHPPGEVLMI